MRLIDADALLNKICKQFDIPDDWDGDIAEPLQTVIDIVDNFDVAYDVEAVVTKLKENSLTKFDWNEAIDLEEAIEIVRNGGKE